MNLKENVGANITWSKVPWKAWLEWNLIAFIDTEAWAHCGDLFPPLRSKENTLWHLCSIHKTQYDYKSVPKRIFLVNICRLHGTLSDKATDKLVWQIGTRNFAFRRLCGPPWGQTSLTGITCKLAAILRSFIYISFQNVPFSRISAP